MLISWPVLAQVPMPQQQQIDPSQESVGLAYRQLGLSINELLKVQQDRIATLQQKLNDLNKYWAEYTETKPNAALTR